MMLNGPLGRQPIGLLLLIRGRGRRYHDRNRAILGRYQPWRIARHRILARLVLNQLDRLGVYAVSDQKRSAVGC